MRAIAGWTDFCARTPQECAVDTAEPSADPAHRGGVADVASVNRRVNARIRPITDQAHWGVVDRWDFPDDGFGDCEDYQLLKRRMLVERGLPRRALLMTVVIDETNEGHAVLTVRTDRGDFILDNKTDAIRSWRRTGYSFIKRAGQDGPAWVSLEGKDGAASRDRRALGRGSPAFGTGGPVRDARLPRVCVQAPTSIAARSRATRPESRPQPQAMTVASMTNGIGRPSIRRPRTVLRRMMKGAEKASIGRAATAGRPPRSSRLKLARRAANSSKALAISPDSARPMHRVRIDSRAVAMRPLFALLNRLRAV